LLNTVKAYGNNCVVEMQRLVRYKIANEQIATLHGDEERNTA